MNAARYDELVATLHEDGLSAKAADELAALVRSQPERRLDLRYQLVLWELWSQQQTPERQADSFVAACRTRLRAETEAGQASFLSALHRRLTHAERTSSARRHWLSGPLAFAWAAPLAAALVALIVWIALPRTTWATTLSGEAVCTACNLHETHDHRPALRVQEGDTTRVYYLEADETLVSALGNFCAAPVPADVTGDTRSTNGRLTLAVRALARHAAPPPPQAETNKDKPTLFPF